MDWMYEAKLAGQRAGKQEATMRITEAVEKGREMLEPRQGNDLYRPEEEGAKYGGCYRGMAVVGAGAVVLPIEDPEEGYDLTDWLKQEWPWAYTRKVYSPCKCGKPRMESMTVLRILGHLWDKHVNPEGMHEPHIEALDDPWTFERMTDWLRSIEPAE
jgi:hypothetical protein